MRFPSTVVSLLLLTASTAMAASPQANCEVLAMQPAAYWPANEGAGEVLHDATANQHHGRIHHVDWSGNQLDFRAAYQWLEIPSRGALRSGDFSMGGWVYLQEMPGGGWRNSPGSTGMVFFGNSNVAGRPWLGIDPDGFSLFIRWNAVLDVAANRRHDALQTRERHFDLSRGQLSATGHWHHLLLSHDSATQTMRLYLNGDLLTEQSGIQYAPSGRAFFIGSDANWWLQSNTSGSLDGSVRELVFFDRPLESDEVNHLFQISRPIQATLNAAAGDSRPPSLDPVRSNDALESLAEQLLAEIDASGVRLPRIEDFDRNTKLATLLRSENDSPVVRRAIHRGLVEPLVARLDPNSAAARPVLQAARQGQPREALARYRDMLGEARPLVSQGDVLRDARPRGPTENVRAYTPQVEHDGVVYKVGTGLPWQGLEAVPAPEFQAISQRLAQDFPAAADWRKPNAPNIYRVPLIRIDPDGNSTKIYLEGPEFVVDGSDEKLKGWSIAIDKDGYIHLTGGMHNSPNPSYYIPGSWERLGLSRDNKSPDFPRAMVWVSTRPYDLESLEFVGQADNPLCPPVPDGLNYMNYLQDRDGELFIYTRIGVSGIQSWGLYRYDTDQRSWSAIGGQAEAVIDDVLAHDPAWERYLERPWGHVEVPSGDEPPALAWAWQPHFYNYIRDNRGIQFDLENRMHLWLRLFAIDGEGQQVYRTLYAFSDDGGASFRRVDGSPVALPLTLNPAPHHQADATLDQAEKWWQLWTSIYHHAGYLAE